MRLIDLLKTNRLVAEQSHSQFVMFCFLSYSSGRIDRKIEFPLPDEKTKRRIFQIHTSRMTVADDVTLDDLILAKDDLSGADIKVREDYRLFPLSLALTPFSSEYKEAQKTITEDRN